MGETREITVRLTNDRSFLSIIVFCAGFGGPTHVAIGLDDSDGFYYSFNTRGFKKEYMVPRKKRRIRATNYKLRVSDESYRLLKDRILKMYEDRSSYAYSGFGVALCLMRIPLRLRFKNKYFCSQFVAEFLTDSGCFNITKKPEMCFPKRIEKEIKDSPLITDVYSYGDLIPIYKRVIDQSVTILKKAGKSAVFYRLMTMRYMKKITKLCIYIMYEQYKEVFSRSNENEK